MRAFPLIRTRALSLVFVAVACGGNAAPSTAPTPEPGGLVAAIDPRVTTLGELNVKATHSAPIDLVWRALGVAYDSVGIKLGVLDPKQHLMGNQGMALRQRLGKTILSKYIECGSSQIGPSADNYEVVMSVISYLHPNEAGETEIVTRVTAHARPPTFGQEYLRCTSKGELEKRLVAFVNATLTRAGH